MRILVLNGNPGIENEDFDSYLSGLSHSLIRDRNEVEILNLREKKIRSCSGCWNCWVKNPGFPFSTKILILNI
jgi:multimeric flavodoxin WrbA